ncbi:hypothetical protein HK097_002859 [Rhizophlyctis rosea]|uniref:Uncharacterized protein n=1 Tax=Rhizophlyctis rosea TaxID=64517 RepID=A0AAD5S2X9_9FUNG|nr:hypothetical protein HK097_002859 [Rhizophlyctis rosea]
MASESERGPRVRVTLEENPPDELLREIRVGRKEEEIQWGGGGRMVLGDGQATIIRPKRRRREPLLAGGRSLHRDKKSQYGAWYIPPPEWSKFHHQNTHKKSQQTHPSKRRSQIQERIDHILSDRAKDDALTLAQHEQDLSSLPAVEVEVRVDADGGDEEGGGGDEGLAKGRLKSVSSRPQTPRRDDGGDGKKGGLLVPGNRGMSFNRPGAAAGAGGRRASMMFSAGGLGVPVQMGRHGSGLLRRGGSRIDMISEDSTAVGA